MGQTHCDKYDRGNTVGVEAITTDSWCDSWCLLCVETLGADTSWPVSVNSL